MPSNKQTILEQGATEKGCEQGKYTKQSFNFGLFTPLKALHEKLRFAHDSIIFN